MTKPVDGAGLTVFAIGSILIYSGMKGYSVLAVAQNLITGKPIANGVTIVNGLSTSEHASSSGGDSGGGDSQSPRDVGRRLAKEVGWTGEQWSALEWIWDHESGWNPHAKNPSSGAYGIPQALPYSKMPKMAWPESAGGQSDAATQIRWGISYIKGRYGTPVLAKAFWQRNGWY